MRFVHLLAPITVLAATLAAQGCPHTRARAVPPSWRMGDTVTCDSGVSMTIGGVTVAPDKAKGCPLFVIITPSHSAEEPATTDTRVKIVGTNSEMVITFHCKTKHFLFIPLSSTCVQDTINTGGQVPVMVTEGCGPAGAS